MTLKNRLAEAEKKVARANQEPFVVRYLNPGEIFEQKYGHAQQPHEFVIQFVAPKVWPDDPDFDATKPLPDE